MNHIDTRLSSNGMKRMNSTNMKTTSKSRPNITIQDNKNEYIENLKRQIHLLENDIYSVKERESQMEKSGGFIKLFDDDTDPTQHIAQLKQKYTNMRKSMESTIEDLKHKKKELLGNNVSIKTKYETIKKLEQENFDKLVNIDQSSQKKLGDTENNLMIRNKERLDLEACNRLIQMDINKERDKNKEYEFTIKSNELDDKFKEKEFNFEISLIESMANEKLKKIQDLDFQKKELEDKMKDDPAIIKELESNAIYKQKIESIELEILEQNISIEQLEVINDFLIQKKENVVSERKKLIQQNDDLKREIEAQNQLNEIRIQKKIKENISPEYRKYEEQLNVLNKTIEEIEHKMKAEKQKVEKLTKEGLKLNIELKHINEIRESLVESVDNKLKEIAGMKIFLDELKKNNEVVKERITSENEENKKLKDKNKILFEEQSALQSKYNFISNNSDFTSNLKKINIDELRSVTQTNSMVNESIAQLSTKLSSFKKQNNNNLFDF